MGCLENAAGGRTVRFVLALVVAVVAVTGVAPRAEAQLHAHEAALTATGRAPSPGGEHLVLTPLRPRTLVDSVRAVALTAELRRAILKYRDTSAAVADGYVMFAPQLKSQKLYHFTSRWRAIQEAFRFEPTKPTSLLYTKGADGKFNLVGAMYTAPKRFDADELHERVPLSVARWHKHVNWCTPARNETERWLERRDGLPLFGPESPIATREACDAVGGRFHPAVFGWMVHANVMVGDDLDSVWGDEHAGHDMHEGMKASPEK